MKPIFFVNSNTSSIHNLLENLVHTCNLRCGRYLFNLLVIIFFQLSNLLLSFGNRPAPRQLPYTQATALQPHPSKQLPSLYKAQRNDIQVNHFCLTKALSNSI